jgi:hypothetical protein
MSLKKDEKILWIYLITSCNHAGIIELNEPLIKFQTGINGLQTVIKGLGNRLILLNNDYYFMPKFLEYQYSKFPNSNVRAQKSAIDILKKFNLWDKEKQTVIKGLVNSYEHEHGSETDDNKKTSKQFYESELEKSNNDKHYALFIEWLFGDNILKRPLDKVLQMEEQISWKQFPSLIDIHNETGVKIRECLIEVENWLMKTPKAKNSTVLGTIRTFAKRSMTK